MVKPLKAPTGKIGYNGKRIIGDILAAPFYIVVHVIEGIVMIFDKIKQPLVSICKWLEFRL